MDLIVAGAGTWVVSVPCNRAIREISARGRAGRPGSARGLHDDDYRQRHGCWRKYPATFA